MSDNLRFCAESAQLYAQLFCKIKQGKEHLVFFLIYVFAENRQLYAIASATTL